MDVVGWRQQRVELAAPQLLPLRDLELRQRRITAIVETAVDRFVLSAAIDADETPGEVIVDRRGRAGRHDEREEAERLILGAVERVLTDAAAHSTLRVRLRAAVGQPAVGREQRGEGRTQRLDAFRVVGNRLSQAIGFIDERADLGRVDQEPEVLVMVMVAKVAHAGRIHTNWPSHQLLWLRQWRLGRSGQHRAVGLEARPVTRAVPRPLRLVPVDEASHVRADGRHHRHRTILVS